MACITRQTEMSIDKQSAPQISVELLTHTCIPKTLEYKVASPTEHPASATSLVQQEQNTLFPEQHVAVSKHFDQAWLFCIQKHSFW